VYFTFSSRATISVAFCCHVVLPYCPIQCLLRCVLWANKVMMMMMMMMIAAAAAAVEV